MMFTASTVCADVVQFYSNQLTPVQEATIFQNVILKDFHIPVDFVPVDGRDVTFSQAVAVAARGKVSVVLGGLLPDFIRLHNEGLLANVDSVWRQLPGRDFETGLREIAKLHSRHQYFVPWMQATYLMVANRKALKYLPAGASLDRLTYDQLEQWAKNMYLATGQRKLGFPAGQNGLMYRFLEGYLTPSFVRNISNAFSEPQAVEMWSYLRGLWRYVTTSSVIFARMDEALLDGHVWVAWDHSARLMGAFRQSPQEFIAFPAPVGPLGRGYLRILAALGVPKGPISASSRDLIAYLTSPKAQDLILSQLGFLPVTSFSRPDAVPQALKEFSEAAFTQIDSANGILGQQPDLTGSDSNRYNLIFLTAFSRIVLDGERIPNVLSLEKPKLEKLLAEQHTKVSVSEP